MLSNEFLQSLQRHSQHFLKIAGKTLTRGKPAVLLHLHLSVWTAVVRECFKIRVFANICCHPCLRYCRGPRPGHKMLSVYSSLFEVPCRISALKFQIPPDQGLRKRSALPLAFSSSTRFRSLLQNPFGFSEKIVQGNSEQGSTKLHPASRCLLAGCQRCLSTLLVLGYEQTTETLLSSLSILANSCLHPHLLFNFGLASPNLAPALCSPTLKSHMIATASHWVFPGGTYSLV